ncbi:hypothetical protein ACOSZP_14235 [Vibrio fluvialis]|uniref:hypothetical protein n=1 Tax=Vibrio fluvialis TaxID=676 RepID=UPI00301D1C84
MPALYKLQMQAAFVLLFSDMAEITGHFMFFDLPLGGLFFAPLQQRLGKDTSRFLLRMI